MQISLSRKSDVPLQRQIAEQIVFLISTGKLRPGQQLPSVRSLAVRLKIHHNTVSKAYGELCGGTGYGGGMAVVSTSDRSEVRSYRESTGIWMN
jgi:DNA-binding transcriptional regulator YhcF (GntR family)